MHVKILKPEVKQSDIKLHAQKFSNQRYHLRKHIHAKILKPEVHVKIFKPDLIKILKPLPLKIWKPGAVKFQKTFQKPIDN